MEIEEARIRLADELPKISSGISKKKKCKRNRMNEKSTIEKLIELIMLT